MSQNLCVCLIHTTAVDWTLKMLQMVQIPRPRKRENCICENEFYFHDAKTGDFIVFPFVFKSCCSIYIFVVKYCFKCLQVGGLQAKAQGNCGAYACRRWSAFENGFLSGVALYGDLVTCWWGSGDCV